MNRAQFSVMAFHPQLIISVIYLFFIFKLMKSLQFVHISPGWEPFSKVVGFSLKMTLFRGVNGFFFF